ncbi:MAG TPA: glycosyltransferase family 4 protein [Vicinamibacterales bacterium]|nr:glycosyltransferase family 4 protein [Vicinamibacterales bacterium]
MRIVYAALDQTVPGTLGGSVHVQSVSEGLAALGHDVHVAVQPGGPWPAGRVRWHPMAPPLGSPYLRSLRRGAVRALARDVRADVIIERYYNFGGEGVRAARDLDIPAVLEVNAPVVDFPGSAKSRIDRALLVQPLRRWRDEICRLTTLFVTPTADILPAWVDRRKVLEIEWGADTNHLRPDAPGEPPFTRDRSRILCVFAGAFRSWHGAIHLSAALARLHAAGDERFGGVFIGDGPEREATRRAGAGVPAIQFTGLVPHANMPAALRHADIGVAPFDPVRHAPLQLGFYWSPLKVFEYMAVGLPVVAPAIPRLGRLVEHGREGLLYDPADPRGLDRAIASLADPMTRKTLGAAARERVVRDFSWQAHCRALDARLREITA